MSLRFPALLALAVALPAKAQEPEPVYQSQTRASRLEFHLDALLRQEWTQDVLQSAGESGDQRRTRFRVLPRVEFGAERFRLGAGGDFNYSSDVNLPETRPALLRDNYDSRDARLDLAFARLEPLAWLRVEGGRFEMPVRLTELIWDRDLRAQGGALTLQRRDAAGVQRYALTGLYSQGGHVFDDDDVKTYLVSGQATFPGQNDSSLQLVATYVTWDAAGRLEPMIRRQNTRVAGALVRDYRVVDLQARAQTAFEPKLQVVADYCWNTAADDDNRGLWLAAVLGSTVSARAKLEYVYARVDKDATLAAYGADDFFWVTGWEGHRGEIATQASKHGSIHLVGQLQKFKDSPRPEERDHWVKRLRAELRFSY